MRHALNQASVRAELELPRDLPRVSGDAGALNQVFLNLLKNAVEAIDGGGGTVTLRGAQKGDAIVVKIHDDGPGIAPELRDRLFEPFFSTKRAGRGTGLGLSISQRIVQEHGGRIEVESELGQGTTFTVHLPVGDLTHAS